MRVADVLLSYRLRRIVLGMVAFAIAYVAITFAQVWWSAGRDEARPVDAIVVLGAAQYDGTPSPALQGRLDHALELYEAGFADYVVTTGANQEGDRFTEGFAGYDYLRDRGVPDEALLVVVDGKDTYESLTAAHFVLDERDLTSVLLVSDPYHSYRVEAIAASVGFEAYVSPTDASSPLNLLIRETGAVSIGRIIGFRRVSNLS